MSQVREADVVGLMRPELAGLEPYVPIHPFEVVSRRLGRVPEQIVKLDANENPYGPSPRAVEAMARYRWLHVYPDPQSTELRQALSTYLQAPVERVLAGHGADELIDLLCRLFLAPGDVLIDCPPTLGMYSFDAGISGARVLSLPRSNDFSLPVGAIEAAVRDDLDTDAAAGRAKLLFLCSPNNPDGGLLPAADLEQLLRLPLVVVVDEAYVEFARPARGQGSGSGLDASSAGLLAASFVSWVSRYPNLVVLRTFSKWAGLGGLRVGYGVFPAPIIEQLWKIKQPYNVNVAGAEAALASLADRQSLLDNVDKLVGERERLYRELEAFRPRGLQPHPGSQANFILVRVESRDARELKLALERHGVLVRHFAKPGVENCLRISVGRPRDTEALLAALDAVTG